MAAPSSRHQGLRGREVAEGANSSGLDGQGGGMAMSRSPGRHQRVVGEAGANPQLA